MCFCQVHASEALRNQTVKQLSDLEASASSIRFASNDYEPPAKASTSGSDTIAPTQPDYAPNAQRHQQSSNPELNSRNSARYSSETKRRQLHSSLALPSTLQEFWYPAEFTARLKKRSLIPLELFHEPWVLFRGSDGSPACVKDTCAHRACPLSLGQVVDGQVSLFLLGFAPMCATSCAASTPAGALCMAVSAYCSIQTADLSRSAGFAIVAAKPALEVRHA